MKNKELTARRGAWCGMGGCLPSLVPLFPPWAADAGMDVDHQLETALGAHPCDALISWPADPEFDTDAVPDHPTFGLMAAWIVTVSLGCVCG